MGVSKYQTESSEEQEEEEVADSPISSTPASMPAGLQKLKGALKAGFAAQQRRNLHKASKGYLIKRQDPC